MLCSVSWSKDQKSRIQSCDASRRNPKLEKAMFCMRFAEALVPTGCVTRQAYPRGAPKAELEAH